MKKASITLISLVFIGLVIVILSNPQEEGDGTELESSQGMAELDNVTAEAEQEPASAIETERTGASEAQQPPDSTSPAPRVSSTNTPRGQRGILNRIATVNAPRASSERSTPEVTRGQHDALTQRRLLLSSEFDRIGPSLRECYDMLLDLEPGVEDRIIVSLEVTTDIENAEKGEVSLLSIDSEQLEITDLGCFAEATDELELPPPLETERQYRVRYPIILNTATETDEEQ